MIRNVVLLFRVDVVHFDFSQNEEEEIRLHWKDLDITSHNLTTSIVTTRTIGSTAGSTTTGSNSTASTRSGSREGAGTGKDFHKSHGIDSLATTLCMHKLEQFLPPLIHAWYESYVPIPYSVKVMNDKFYVLFSVLHIDLQDQTKWRKGSDVLCNSIQGGKIMKTLERLGRPTLIVECPDSLKSSITRLETLTFHMTKMQGNETHDIVSYNVTLFDECERLDQQYFSNLPNNLNNIRIGMTTSFKGNRNRALEWATYHHHIIGIDHIWIYVNEPWDDGTRIGNNLPFREYITWIPFNFSIAHGHFKRKHNYIPTEHFRIASQNDALWRAKRMRLDWLAIIDLDEYIFCGVSSISSRNITSYKGISGELKHYLAMKQIENNLLEKFGAVEMNSVPFGRNVDVEPDMKNDSHKHNSHHDGSQLLMDYTWRQKGDPNTFPFRRMKLIVNPLKVTSVNIHYIGGGDRAGVQVWSAPANDLRINHYRTPQDGVYDQNHGQLETIDLQQDTLVRDRYRDVVLEKMKLGK
jgi:Domain of unknown function.